MGRLLNCRSLSTRNHLRRQRLCCFFTCKCRLRGGGPAAIRLPPPPLTPSRLLPLPRRLQHRAAEAHGRRKPEEGGSDQGRRGHDSVSPDLAGEQGRAQRRLRSGAPASRCAARGAQVRLTGGCAERLRAAGKLLLLGCWSQMGGGRKPPPSSQRKVQCGEGGCGAPGPQSGESGAQPSPYLSGWGGHQPRALAGRPGEENHREGRAGEKQRAASGQGRRVKFHS